VKNCLQAFAAFKCNARDAFGNTPLIVACQNGQGRLAKMCMRYGSDVNLQNGKGNAALHFTVQYGFSALGDFLLEEGADPSVLNQAGLHGLTAVVL
jgi:ankyrin repeat protein